MAPAPPPAPASFSSSTNTIKHVRTRSLRDEEDPRAASPSLKKDDRLAAYARGGASVANSLAPGSFSSTLKSANGSKPPSRNEDRENDLTASERRQAELRDKINKETKIKIGSENMLEALQSKNTKGGKDQRLRVESQLSSSNKTIALLQVQLQEEIERSKRAATPFQSRLSSLFRGSTYRSPSRGSGSESGEEDEEDEEKSEDDSASPTFVLGEILQSLEVEGMQPDYYVKRANNLVDLFKRHPTLKYDIAWPIFGLRVQTMMLSESREVVAAGYRVTRHAFADRGSLQTARGLATDTLVIVSLAKDSKATIEREQALKFVRGFLDVKDGVHEIAVGVLRAIVSVAENFDDRLRNVALLTLAEILVKRPPLLVGAGGVNPLAEVLRDGSYAASDSLAAVFLRLTDAPQQRKLLYAGQELAGPFSLFSDPLPMHGHEERLKASARAISATINSWTGLFSLSANGFSGIRSLLWSLAHPLPTSRNLILDLLFDIFNIEPPSWVSSFLAGRRLTTYGRQAHMRDDQAEQKLEDEDDMNRANLVEHYTSLVLYIFIRCGLIEALSELVEELEDLSMHRKTTLLLSEVLKLADYILPKTVSANIQTLAKFMPNSLEDSNDPVSSFRVFQVDRVNKTLNRTANPPRPSLETRARSDSGAPLPELPKTKYSVDMDEIQFRNLMSESAVVSHSSYLKWKWDVINDIIEGPLKNPKRLEDAKSTKFLKRIIGFYRPFKYRFSGARSTKPNQRYVRTGCLLVKSLLQTPEGVAFLGENKLLRQLAECLAQMDKMSGITSTAPLFSPERVQDTLTGSYFSILGAMSSDPQGLNILTRWKMINMFYHILDLRERVDIIKLLLENMDFTLDSHLRVMLSKALTSGPKGVRSFATQLLRKYATQEIESNGPHAGRASDVACWAIRLLVTQLYDPHVEVSEVAVQILQESCNRKPYLEFVVRCRPALDHLGEIGAPLLLRFLSTSIGYRYLHGLDYITQEMDDWFLGRNEKYVALVEASLSRAFSHHAKKPEAHESQLGFVPPHFYRELTRTKEGCQLLEDSGHFEEFVSTIKDFWREDEDAETILKVKGCLWAVGNVGSMELGAPFLEKSNVVEWIVKIVEQSGVVSLRGTAFFVLGLVSRSWHGMEILAEKRWDVATGHMGQSLGYVLPPTLEHIFPSKGPPVPLLPPPSLAATEPQKAPAQQQQEDPYEARIIAAVVESGNTVLSRRAINELSAVRARKPELFRSCAVFRRVMGVLAAHNVRLPIRQRLFDLFDKDVMRRIVMDDAEEGDE